MNLLGVPDCNLTNIDYQTGIEVLNALQKCFERYPLLKNVINSVGSYRYILERKALAAKRMYDKKLFDKDASSLYKTSYFFASTLFFDDIEEHDHIGTVLYKNRLIYTGIGINEKESYKAIKNELNTYERRNISYCTNISDCVYHEVGHILAKMLCLKKNDVVVKKVDLLMQNGEYPKYTVSSFDEFIADCFSKYMTNPNYNTAVNTVGLIIDLFYDYSAKYCEKFYSQASYNKRVLKIER